MERNAIAVTLKKIISGGQTGVDRAALDAALACGFPCGGWCPLGRRAEDGPLHARYPLTETPSPVYAVRTEQNVADADGTLVLVQGEPSGGTALTIDLAVRLKKPCLVVNLRKKSGAGEVLDWLRMNRIRVLNIAGPRESQRPGIYTQALTFLQQLLAEVPRRPAPRKPRAAKSARSGQRRTMP